MHVIVIFSFLVCTGTGSGGGGGGDFGAFTSAPQPIQTQGLILQ